MCTMRLVNTGEKVTGEKNHLVEGGNGNQVLLCKKKNRNAGEHESAEYCMWIYTPIQPSLKHSGTAILMFSIIHYVTFSNGCTPLS